ncbi:periplasmic nitrate reductase, NapE protein [Aquibium sp. A9E412]|uniref:periplasmic nitrate reductase, NapE protein n=1 Tax=Aquibium sp. A9E412 TaxID=2976767 RepID=UPI0025AF0838|nr:periplasmic nitrate reductase, NapE protein [Aquibium sp. A9E412]MDN2566320.1 periplasmic nitrate reductase, NapE protein [Aquibium sp. A9E412]
MASSGEGASAEATPQKKHETIAFLLLAFVLFPVLSVIFVGGFGFVVWMQHLVFGPPGY